MNSTESTMKFLVCLTCFQVNVNITMTNMAILFNAFFGRLLHVIEMIRKINKLKCRCVKLLCLKKAFRE